ncbi:MAG: TonB-dependent receptor [Chitinophagaceae bacterium]
MRNLNFGNRGLSDLRWLCLLMAWGISFAASAQQSATLSGTVLDERGGMVPSATIVMQNQQSKEQRTTTSDDQGLFTFNNLAAGIKYRIQVSSVGFQSYELKDYILKAGEGNSLILRLPDSTRSLDNVVVVGYGTQKVATITGSVSTMKGERLQQSPAVNLSNSLAGRIPGLVAITPSGEPGSDNSTLRIRGANTLGDNSPLVVVDGIASRSFERLNPADIESVTVLKDASAAIYGARAANGVILVTTKKGTSDKPQVRFSYNEARIAPTVIPETTDAATYAQLINEILEYEGAPAQYSPADLQKYRDGSDPLKFPNTDWYKETLKDWSVQRSADVSISGGNDNMRYYISAGTRFQDAVYNKSATFYKQHNFRINLDGKFSRYVRYGVNVAYREENRNYPTESSAQIWGKLRQSKPNMPAYWPGGEAADNGDSGNPLVISTNQTGYDKNKTMVLESKANISIDVPGVPGLSFSANAAVDRNVSNDKSWNTPWYLYSWDGTSMTPSGAPVLQRVQRGYTNAELTQNMADANLVTLNALGNYQHTFGAQHHVKVLVGAEKITGENMDFMAFRKNFVSTAIDQMFAGGDADKNNSGSASQQARLNYFGRLNYDYDGKYLAEFVWRADGSFIFPENSRFGFFPGVSLGWKPSKENFWGLLGEVVNDFKIRASWGRTGNDRITAYQFLSSYGFLTGPTNVYVFNQTQEQKILSELRIPNPNVTWEVANQSNIGFDALFLNNKLSVSAEYFSNLRTNILWKRNASVPLSSGLTLPNENIGEVTNQGAEFQLGYNDRIGEFTYSISGNIAFNKNKIRFWDETPGVPAYQQSTGYAMNTGLYYNAIGIFRDEQAVAAYPHWTGARAGDVRFEDVNKDGMINALDRIRVNKTDLPTQTGGVNIDLGYKGFFASVFFQWATGAMRNNYYELQGQAGNYLADDVEGRWTSSNMDASKPRIWNRYNEYWRNNQNTYWLQSTDYIRLKNVQLGYNLNATTCRRIGATAAQVYLSGLNLLTFTKVKNMDPETTSNSAYPLNKVVNLGITLNF